MASGTSIFRKIANSGHITGLFSPAAEKAPPVCYIAATAYMFDGCRHGYDNLFCDTWAPEEVSQRTAAELFRDADGNELFEVVAYAFHNIDYDEEREEFEDAEGRISLLSGEIVDLPYLQRNGFDGFGIMLYSANGEKVKAHERELA